MKLTCYTDILWDFNGTILDDVNAGIVAVNRLLSERSLPQIESVEAYHAVFGFPVIDYYRRLGFDFEKEPFDVIAPLWVAEYLEASKNATLCWGVTELLEFFAKHGKRQTVISATETKMLENQIKALGIADYFVRLYGIDNIRGESKEYLAYEWRKNNPNAVALFIGDTLHDYDVAKAAGADCILVSSGHQSESILRDSGCPTVATSAEQILELFSGDKL